MIERRSLSDMQRTAAAAREQAVWSTLRRHMYCDRPEIPPLALDRAGVHRQGLCDLQAARAHRAHPPTPASSHLRQALQHPERTVQAKTCPQEMAAKATGPRASGHRATVGSGVALGRAARAAPWSIFTSHFPYQPCKEGSVLREILLYTTPLGLALDIAGFLLIIRYGHSLFIRSGVGPPPSKGKDGDLYLRREGPVEGHGDRRRLWAYVGVAIVCVGLVLQGVGPMAAILCPSN